MECSPPATATTFTGRCAETRQGSPPWCCTAAPARAASRGTGEMFDPERYRVVLLDQRGCGRSTPSAGSDLAALEANTTPHLLDDIEAVRELLDIDRWLVWGGSFGCELALAYAERYPARVSELVLWGITTGRRSEADWLFRGGVGVMFPEQWYRFAAAAGDDDPVAGYRRLLHDPDPAVHRKAAEDWCAWESVTPDWPPANGIAERFRDPGVRARLRAPGHPLRAPRPLDRGRQPAPRRRPAGRSAGDADPRPVRPAGAAGLGLGPAPGAAGRHAGRRRRGRPCRGRHGRCATG